MHGGSFPSVPPKHQQPQGCSLPLYQRKLWCSQIKGFSSASVPWLGIIPSVGHGGQQAGKCPGSDIPGHLLLNPGGVLHRESLCFHPGELQQGEDERWCSHNRLARLEPLGWSCWASSGSFLEAPSPAAAMVWIERAQGEPQDKYIMVYYTVCNKR